MREDTAGLTQAFLIKQPSFVSSKTADYTLVSIPFYDSKVRPPFSRSSSNPFGVFGGEEILRKQL